MILRIVTLCMSLLAPTANAQEQPPVAPQLAAATQAWLQGGDTRDALWTIGTLAIQWDMDARYLARAIYLNFVHYDYPDLDREGRKALFPSDWDTTRFTSPYPIDEDRMPAHAARQLIMVADTPQAWQEQADILFDTGFVASLRMAVGIAHNHGSMQQAQAVQYMETRVGPDDPIWYVIWFIRGSESRIIDTFMDIQPDEMTARQALWDGAVWGPKQDAQFTQALNDGRWSAIRALGLLRIFAHEREGALVEVDADVARIADLTFGYARATATNRPPPPTPTELDTIGSLIARDADRAAYLMPLRRACEATCPDQENACMAIGAITKVFDLSGLRHIEFGRALHPDTYNRSPRAAPDLLARVGTIYQTDRAFAIDMPACFKEAALAAAPDF